MRTQVIDSVNWAAGVPALSAVQQLIAQFARGCARRFHRARIRQAQAYIARRRRSPGARVAPGGAAATSVYWL